MLMEVYRSSPPRSFHATLGPTPQTVIQGLGSSIRYLPQDPPPQLNDNTPVIVLEEFLLEENRSNMQKTLLANSLTVPFPQGF
ncbi:hypothetical protein AAC387_Pa02g4647 [Persea americana]